MNVLTLIPNSDVMIKETYNVHQSSENNLVNLHTFNRDLDDVLCSAQLVCGCTAVVPSVSFIHVRNLKRFLEVIKGHPAARQLSSILLPGDLWSGPVTELNTTGCFSAISAFRLLCCQMLFLRP